MFQFVYCTCNSIRPHAWLLKLHQMKEGHVGSHDTCTMGGFWNTPVQGYRKNVSVRVGVKSRPLVYLVWVSLIQLAALVVNARAVSVALLLPPNGATRFICDALNLSGLSPIAAEIKEGPQVTNLERRIRGPRHFYSPNNSSHVLLNIKTTRDSNSKSSAGRRKFFVFQVRKLFMENKSIVPALIKMLQFDVFIASR